MPNDPPRRRRRTALPPAATSEAVHQLTGVAKGAGVAAPAPIARELVSVGLAGGVRSAVPASPASAGRGPRFTASQAAQRSDLFPSGAAGFAAWAHTESIPATELRTADGWRTDLERFANRPIGGHRRREG